MKRASESGILGSACPARLAVCRQGTVVLGVGDGLDVWSLSLRSCCSSNRPLASRRGHTLIRAPQPQVDSPAGTQTARLTGGEKRRHARLNVCAQELKCMEDMWNGTLVAMSCSYGSAVF